MAIMISTRHLGPFIISFTFVILSLCLIFPAPVFCLKPDQVLVIANRNCPESLSIAKYYMDKRRLPFGNLFTISLPVKDSCTREEYEKSLVLPLRRLLTTRGRDRKAPRIRCLLLTYGIPLKIRPPILTKRQKIRCKQIKEKIKAIEEILVSPKTDKKKKREFNEQVKHLKKELSRLEATDTLSSLDSELSLVMIGDYPISGWLPNPLYIQYIRQKIHIKGLDPRKILMVSRLDGPNTGTVKRMIDDALFAETNGLKGRAYFDCRYAKIPEPPKSAYQLYDKYLREAAKIVENTGCMKKVILDTSPSLFASATCPKAALYCGWYSLSHYVDAFTWVPGAVAYHIASGECVTLRGQTNGWCKMLLLDGVAATLGPVAEPYLQAFPPPHLFFSLLLSGRYTLVECYYLSCPFLSWRMVLLGDPLYSPFKNGCENQ